MQLSEKILRLLKVEHISPEELSYMLRHAAITSIDGYNRRYFDWLFKVEKEVLQDMRHVDMVEIGRGESRVYEDHEACHGEGCRECGWVGSICRWVTDPKAVSMNGYH